MKKRDAAFWKRHASRGALIEATRSYREEAIRFFGAFDVLKEDESALILTLEARRIIMTPDRKLLLRMNRNLPEIILCLNDPKKAKYFRRTLLTPAHIKAMKCAAKQHIRDVTGQTPRQKMSGSQSILL
ncbi:MAG: hypothetical protein ACLQVY_25475 [Limisphaerales bacterium]